MRIPKWACSKFAAHGADHICAACLQNFERQDSKTQGFDMPPRVKFGRGWFSVGATHWFGATDETLFDSRDGKRLLAQAVCGGICMVSMAWAPQAGRECRKCIAALRKLGVFAESSKYN